MKLTTKSFKTLILLVGAIFLMANRGGSPGGRTGSSTDGGTCTTNGGCHGPKTPTAQEMISTSIPSSGYIPGETYTFTILAKKTGVEVWGFEMMCEDENGDGIGAFVANKNVTVSGFRATHKFSSSDSVDAIMWNVDWVAPATGTGDVDIYCAVLATNNSQTNGGDNAFIDTLTISENTAVSIAHVERYKLSVYPNPTSDYVNIEGNISNSAKIEIYNSNLNTVIAMPFQNSVDLRDLATGVYFIKVIDGDAILTHQIFKN